MKPDNISTIIITGGNFINKGAESMLMTTVDGIHRHFPGYEPILVDLFPTLDQERKAKCPFRIINMHVRSLFRIRFPFLKLFFGPKAISDDEEVIKETFNSASAIFDISGYGLSSHNQPLLWSIAYLLPFQIAKERNIPVWLLPQSMGPFHFKGIKKLLFEMWGKSLINYPEVIFAREPKALDELRRVRSKSVVLSPDLVLQSEEFGKANDIPGDEVLVIPNRQLFRIRDEDTILNLYVELINEVLNYNIEVRVIRHSLDDLLFCKKLRMMINHDLLTIDTEELSLSELNLLINNSRFVISGRYHGAVHAIKAQRPVIIIGWAEKYRHLADMFTIMPWFIDISREVSTLSSKQIVSSLIEREKEIRSSLYESLRKLNNESVWSMIKLPNI